MLYFIVHCQNSIFIFTFTYFILYNFRIDRCGIPDIIWSHLPGVGGLLRAGLQLPAAQPAGAGPGPGLAAAAGEGRGLRAAQPQPPRPRGPAAAGGPPHPRPAELRRPRAWCGRCWGRG